MPRFAAPSFLLKIATGRNVLLFLALFIVFSGFIMPSFESDIKALSGGVGVIDLEFYYSPAKVLSMLGSYGAEGIHLYLIAQWTVDLIFPLIAGLFFSTCLLWVDAKRWWWLGVVITLVDWTENVFVTLLLVNYPDFSPGLAWGSSAFTSLKWTTLMVCNCLILFHGGKKLLARNKARVAESRVS